MIDPADLPPIGSIQPRPYPIDVWNEPMACVCDHGGPETKDWCKLCPFREANRAAAKHDFAVRWNKEIA